VRALKSLPHLTPIRAVICLVVGAVLWPAETVEAQARRGGRGRPTLTAEVVAGSLERSTEALSFRIAVEVPAGHHGYIDQGDDGFLIPFSFSFPELEETGVVEMTTAPRGVRDDKIRAQVLRGHGDFAFRLVPAPRPAAGATARLRYQICNDVTGICYPPAVLRIPVATGSGSRSTTPDPGQDRYIESSDAVGLGNVIGYGRGAAFVDIDGDGFDDLFVADSDNRHRTDDFAVSQMYLNKRDGTFEPVDIGINSEDLIGTWVGSFADYDQDGDPDILIANGGYTMASSLAFYENRMSTHNRFVDVTSASGITGSTTKPDNSFWWGAAWADYDNDGWLDVIITRRNSSALLLHNEGDKTFTETGMALGINIENMLDSKNPVWFDFDEDGDQDLYLAGMDVHAFYENRVNTGQGFTDITDLLGLSSERYPVVFAAITADLDQDGHEDLYLGRWDEQDYILFSDGKGHFQALGPEAGLDAILEYSSVPYENTMGLGIGDLHDDGYPDILIGTGAPSWTGADIVFCNNGNRSFSRCTDLLIDKDDNHMQTRAHGVVFADVNRDGYTDFFWNLGGWSIHDLRFREEESRETNKYYIRDTSEEPSSAWVTLQGTTSNIDAIGSRVEVTYENNKKRYYFIHSTTGFQSQNSKELLIPLFGFNQAQLEITWPKGNKSQHVITSGVNHRIIEP
jgi:hypothetical protein